MAYPALQHRQEADSASRGGNTEAEGYVLVVDDEPDAQLVLEGILRPLGLDVQMADDGHDALQQIKARQPSLVLLDLLMPRMDGFEVLARLRGNPATRHIPIVVVTACDVNQQMMLRLPGVERVIRKGDYRVRDLQKLVAGLLGRDLSDAAASNSAPPTPPTVAGL